MLHDDGPVLSPAMRRRLDEAREGVDEAQQVKEDTIGAAWKAGGGMREIAEAVGMTHVGVSKLLERVGARERHTTMEIVERERRGPHGQGRHIP